MRKTAQTGEMILALLVDRDMYTSDIVEALTPRLKHVRDPEVAVRSALSKLKTGHRIEHKPGFKAWTLGPNQERVHATGRPKIGRTNRNTTVALHVESSVRDEFARAATARGMSQADLFTEWVRSLA